MSIPTGIGERGDNHWSSKWLLSCSAVREHIDCSLQDLFQSYLWKYHQILSGSIAEIFDDIFFYRVFKHHLDFCDSRHQSNTKRGQNCTDLELKRRSTIHYTTQMPMKLNINIVNPTRVCPSHRFQQYSKTCMAKLLWIPIPGRNYTRDIIRISTQPVSIAMWPDHLDLQNKRIQ